LMRPAAAEKKPQKHQQTATAKTQHSHSSQSGCNSRQETPKRPQNRQPASWFPNRLPLSLTDRNRSLQFQIRKMSPLRSTD
jgi:hypothetical protein